MPIVLPIQTTNEDMTAFEFISELVDMTLTAIISRKPLPWAIYTEAYTRGIDYPEVAYDNIIFSNITGNNRETRIQRLSNELSNITAVNRVYLRNIDLESFYSQQDQDPLAKLLKRTKCTVVVDKSITKLDVYTDYFRNLPNEIIVQDFDINADYLYARSLPLFIGYLNRHALAFRQLAAGDDEYYLRRYRYQFYLSLLHLLYQASTREDTYRLTLMDMLVNMDKFADIGLREEQFINKLNELHISEETHLQAFVGEILDILAVRKAG